MFSRFTSPGRPGRQIHLVKSSLESCSRRGVASTSAIYKEAAALPNSNTSAGESSSNPPIKSSGPAIPSSCPPGTVLTGLSLYKDRADPVALPDNEYPDWLWKILDDPSATSASGAALESTAGLSKGEARAAQKRNMKAVRAAQKGKGKQPGGPGVAGSSGAGAGMNAVGEISEGEVDIADAGVAERAQGAAAISVERASKRSAEEEKAAKKALRKASRESIKARNFIGAR